MSETVNTVILFYMKTSLDLPDDLYRRVKSKSALEGRAVREVATALFTAWVDGKVPAVEGTTLENSSSEPDPAALWLERWRELTAEVGRSIDGTPGLTEQLDHDRR